LKKFMVLMAAVLVLVGFVGFVFAAEISNLVLEGGSMLPVNAKPELKFLFMSDQKPDEVMIRFYGDYAGRIIQTVYWSKKGEIKTEVTEKAGGAYEVSAVRTIGTPPAPGKCEVMIWITAGSQESNKLKQELEFK
jgi:hypothetical protein